jgi:hypothetical protein
MPFELFDLDVDEVSGVDAAANLRTFLVIKARKADHQEPDGDEMRPQDYASRQRQADLWSCLYDKWDLFRTTLWDIMGDCDEDNIPHLPILVTSIGQFQEDVAQLLADCGVLAKAQPLLEELAKIGAVMSAERKQRLQAAIDQLQCLLDEACTVKTARKEPMAEKEGSAGKALVVEGHVPSVEEHSALRKRAETAEATLKTAEATVATLSEKIDGLVAELAKARQTPEEQEAEYLASLPPVIRQKREAELLEMAELRKETQLAKERAEQTDYVAKAATLAGIGLTPNHWRCLKALDVLATQGYEEERTEILRLLTAANEQLVTAPLFATVGTGAGLGTTHAAGAGASAQDQILTLAKARATEKDLPMLQAIDAIAKEQPELWKRHQEEQRLKNRGQVR